MAGWVDGRMDGCVDGWMGERMDGWMDGWVDRRFKRNWIEAETRDGSVKNLLMRP